MPETFIPLMPAATAGPVKMPLPASDFKPLAPAGTATLAPNAASKPAIILQRNPSGGVTAIRVQCACGCVTELNCVY